MNPNPPTAKVFLSSRRYAKSILERADKEIRQSEKHIDDLKKKISRVEEYLSIIASVCGQKNPQNGWRLIKSVGLFSNPWHGIAFFTAEEAVELFRNSDGEKKLSCVTQQCQCSQIGILVYSHRELATGDDSTAKHQHSILLICHSCREATYLHSRITQSERP